MKAISKPKAKISLKKVKSAATQDSKNLENVKKSISKEKDLIYRYPKGCSTLPERKKFRTDARRHKASFVKRISKLKGAERAALVKEANSWASKVYENAYLPKF